MQQGQIEITLPVQEKVVAFIGSFRCVSIIDRYPSCLQGNCQFNDQNYLSSFSACTLVLFQFALIILNTGTT